MSIVLGLKTFFVLYACIAFLRARFAPARIALPILILLGTLWPIARELDWMTGLSEDVKEQISKLRWIPPLISALTTGWLARRAFRELDVESPKSERRASLEGGGYAAVASGVIDVALLVMAAIVLLAAAPLVGEP